MAYHLQIGVDYRWLLTMKMRDAFRNLINLVHGLISTLYRV